MDKKEEEVEVKKVMEEEEKDDDVFPDAESWAEQEGNGESSTYVKAINGASDDFGEYGNGGRNQTRNYFGAIDALTMDLVQGMMLK